MPGRKEPSIFAALACSITFFFFAQRIVVAVETQSDLDFQFRGKKLRSGAGIEHCLCSFSCLFGGQNSEGMAAEHGALTVQQ